MSTYSSEIMPILSALKRYILQATNPNTVSFGPQIGIMRDGVPLIMFLFFFNS